MENRDKGSRKILVICNMFPSAKYPHYGVFVENAANLLRKSGYKVTVCGMPKCDSKAEKLYQYARLYGRSILLGVFGGYDAVYAHYISHTALPVRIIKALRPGIKVIENAHGNDVVVDTPADEINIIRSRKALAITDWVVVPSEYYRTVMETDFSFPPQRIVVSPSGGVNHQVFVPHPKDEARAHCGMNLGAKYIGYISRIEPRKGWETFLRAAALLRARTPGCDLRFLIVGGGSEENSMNALIAELDLNDVVDCRPLASQSELSWYYSALDAFCFPSERESESLGLVGLEAMACGVPVICSNARGIATYAVNDQNCLMFPKGSAEDLCVRMEESLTMDPQRKAQLWANAVKTAMQYDSRKIQMEFCDAFNMMLEN